MAQLEVRLRRIHKDDLQAALRGFKLGLSDIPEEDEVAAIVVKLLEEYHVLKLADNYGKILKLVDNYGTHQSRLLAPHSGRSFLVPQRLSFGEHLLVGFGIGGPSQK
jgi:hypothetical protein